MGQRKVSKLIEKQALKQFLHHHKIKNIYGKKIRTSHLARRIRKHFPEIAEEVNPDGLPWTKARVSELCEFVSELDPSEYTANTPQQLQQAQLRRERKKRKTEKTKFFGSWQWATLRYETLQKYGAKCMLCGATRDDAIIQVDHVKPVHTHWHLRSDPKNLQVLCKPCNMGKGAHSQTDFRE